MWFTKIFLAMIGLVAVSSPPYYIDAFNVETKHYAVYRSEAESMFGFAVTVYRDRYSRGWAVVGAPAADISQIGVTRGGGVYKCDIAADDKCTLINFDNKGNNYVKTPGVPGGLTQVDNKTSQWFGATVSASYRDGGPILACAPRYIWFSVPTSKQDSGDNRWKDSKAATGNRREPVGTCWVASNNLNESQEFSPCRTKYWGYHRQGSCQAGLGAAISKNGERVFIGAPGSWYWQGQIYSISTAMKLKFVATLSLSSEGETSGQAFSQPLNSRAKIMYTKEGPATEDDSYMGYSVATGDFIGNGDSGIAVGVPRGYELLGKVILFTSNMTNPRNLTGKQMGEYFGYAIASGDIDGDGLDDLIVGAPMYTVPNNPEMTIETGRIFVFYQGSGPEKFRNFDTREGESNRGRFGLSLSSLGDIDRDGFGDFVVGAPYGGPHGRGAVYIYHGSPTGVLEKYSQVIYADDLDVPVKTFGFSVAGGLDLDDNHYPDLVVGAYDSATAMFFRSRPVIKIDSYVTFETESKLISLDNRNCTLSDGSRVTCLSLRACFKYSGQGVFSRHNFNIQYVLDVKKTKNPRLFFLELEGRNTMNYSMTVERDRQFCRKVQVYVTPNIRDKLTSLDAEMRMSLDEDRLPDTRRRDPRIPLRPVLATTTSRKDTLSIRKNCGEDNICIPDLQLNVTPNVAKYLLGSGKRLELEVLVQNRGDDAFEATFNLKVPSGIDYIKIERIEPLEVAVQCSAPKQLNNNTLRCDIGNPLPKNKLVKFKVLLQPVTSHGMKPIYDFDMEVNTTNPENPATTDDNHVYFPLPIWIETDLRVDGKSKPQDLYYNPDNYTEANVTTEFEFGPAIMHNYTIRNQGPSDILEAEAILIWPARTLDGNELLYLLEQPETSDLVTCQTANANYLSLKLDQRKKSYFHYQDPSGVTLDESQTGRMINVQRGFEIERNKLSQKEESEINSGDSSTIQKSRHSFSTSTSTNAGETRRIQLTNAGNKPDVLITTYTQNKSGTNSIDTGDLTGGNGGVVFHSESGSYGGSTNLGGAFHTGNQETIFGTTTSSLEEHHRSGTGYSESVESRWGGTNVMETHTISSTSEMDDSVLTENERRYFHRQEEQRRQEEELRLRRIQEEKRLEMQREMEQRERLVLERQRLEQERLLALRRQEEEERREQSERTDELNLEEETRHGILTGGYHRNRENGFITGDREETVGGGEFGLHLRNVSSTQELERLFNSLSKEASNYNLYSRQGRQYVQFMGRFKISPDRKEYIEFQDGSTFPLQDRFGKQSYVSESTEPRESRFLRMEGQLLISSNGRGFIVLKDGRRFALHGSYSYTEERTYNLGDSHGGLHAGTNGNEQESRSYSRSWHEESSSQTGEPERDYDASFTRTHNVKRTEERRVSGRINDRSNFESRTNEPDPNQLNSRFRRESDMIDVEEFKRFEKTHRHRRDTGRSASIDESVFNTDVDYDDQFCETAKCVKLQCVFGPLKKDDEVWISARYRIDAKILKKLALLDKVQVSTKLVAHVTRQPFIGKPAEEVIKSHEITTNIVPNTTASIPDIIPLWVVVLSACAGTIILLLLIYLLHKCGFFKRNRPSDTPERQPLNRNGHFQHGDDH